MTKQPGSTNYTVGEQRRLLEMVRHVLPTDRVGWDAVAAAYNAHTEGWKVREGVSLKRKFSSMYKALKHSGARRTDTTDLAREAGQLKAKLSRLALEGNLRCEGRTADARNEPHHQLPPSSENAPSESIDGGDADGKSALDTRPAATYKKHGDDGTPCLQSDTTGSDGTMTSTRIDHRYEDAGGSGSREPGAGSISSARRNMQSGLDRTDKPFAHRRQPDGAVMPQKWLALERFAGQPHVTHQHHHLSDLRRQFKRYKHTARRHHKELLAYIAALTMAVDGTPYRQQEMQQP